MDYYVQKGYMSTTNQQVTFAPYAKRIDLSGLRVGRLLVVGRGQPLVTPKGRAVARWECACDCGGRTLTTSSLLKSGATKSCGCLARERFTKWARSRPKYRARLTWLDMRKRCLNPRSDRYPAYGGRGIKICDRWMAFENFLADMGERPEGFSLERDDVNGHYEPSNCRWIPLKEQRFNRRDSVRLEHRGTIKCLMQIALEEGVKYSALRRRVVTAGESLETALSVLKAYYRARGVA